MLEQSVLYDPLLLSNLKFENWPKAAFNPPLSARYCGESLKLRPLRIDDFEKGYTSLLGQLTTVGDVSKAQFEETFAIMKKCPNTYYVTVIEDTNTGEVVGSATLLMEQKIIHGCAKRGRIEDVVVSNKHRGKQLGKYLVTVLILLAQHLNCYKLSLDCKDDMIPFYNGLGFIKEPKNGNFMIIRYEAKL